MVIRGLWGFIGPQRARFSDFVYSPRTVLAYLADLVRLHAVRYVGHSPAGGAMVIALLFMLAATVATGVMTLGADKHTGPLASFYRVETQPGAESSARKSGANTALRAGGDENGSRRPAPSDESALSELHEVLANITLILIGFHVAGVALASIVHRENLVLAMITGRKRAQPGPPDS